jgi:anaerobic ribonucleoside-triphosphate reductase activating protein
MLHALDLADTILATPEIEGITLTGGEPFEQAAPLTSLVSRIRPTGLSVMVFTGFELDELVTDAQQLLLASCDVVVAGRYRHQERSLDLVWRGSSNQTVHFLTARYSPASMPEASECEVHIAPDGGLTLTGFPPSTLAE